VTSGLSILPPKSDEIELTILGRGYGESVVLHVGDNNWIVVDSFKTKNKAVAALDYLNMMGLGSAYIVAIVASHWHDDHIGGISDLYGASTQASFALSSALKRDEFLAFVGSNPFQSFGKVTSGVNELLQVRDIARETNRKALLLAGPAQYIFRRDSSRTSFNQNVYALSLSPSSADVQAFLTSLKPEAIRDTLRFTSERNDASVVMWVQVGNVAMLLGGDLEQTRSDRGGWTAIVQSETRPSGTVAEVFKIPHHGSKTGHSDEVWDEMVGPNAIADVGSVRWSRSCLTLRRVAHPALELIG